MSQPISSVRCHIFFTNSYAHIQNRIGKCRRAAVSASTTFPVYLAPDLSFLEAGFTVPARWPTLEVTTAVREKCMSYFGIVSIAAPQLHW